MKTYTSHLLLLATTLCLAKPCASSAQEFFRDYGTSRSSGGIGPITPSEYTYEDSSPSGLRPLRPGQDLSIVEQTEENDKYNFALGPIHFGVAAGFGIEFNDNITLSDSDRQSDIILRPTLDLQASWRLSELNTIRLSVGVGYAKYLDHSELDTDGPLISPNSELEFTVFVGPVKLTLRDRFSYQEDTYDVAPLSNTAKYRRYENQAGIQADYQINQNLDLVAGYDHFNLWTPSDEFQLQERSIETFYVKPSFQINPAVKVGLNVSYSLIDFSSENRGDGDSLLVGPFVEWQISEFTNIYLEGGYQSLKFDQGGDFSDTAIDQLGLNASDSAAVRDILRDNEDSDSFYIKFEINNKLTENFIQRLSFSKTSEIGFVSNSFDLYHVEYNADWKAFRNTEIGPTLFYEYYTTSGNIGEKASRYGAAMGIRYHWSNSITLGLDYRFILKDSDLANSDYYQNLVLLSIYYKF